MINEWYDRIDLTRPDFPGGSVLSKDRIVNATNRRRRQGRPQRLQRGRISRSLLTGPTGKLPAIPGPSGSAQISARVISWMSELILKKRNDCRLLVWLSGFKLGKLIVRKSFQWEKDPAQKGIIYGNSSFGAGFLAAVAANTTTIFVRR